MRFLKNKLCILLLILLATSFTLFFILKSSFPIPSINSLINPHKTANRALLFNGHFYPNLIGWGDRLIKLHNGGVIFVSKQKDLYFYNVSFSGENPSKLKAEPLDMLVLEIGKNKEMGGVYVKSNDYTTITLGVDNFSGSHEYIFRKNENGSLILIDNSNHKYRN